MILNNSKSQPGLYKPHGLGKKMVILSKTIAIPTILGSECLSSRAFGILKGEGYGRGGTPIFTDVFDPLARVAPYPTDEDGLGTCFGAA